MSWIEIEIFMMTSPTLFTQLMRSVFHGLMAVEYAPQGLRVTEVRPTLMMTNWISQDNPFNVKATEEFVKWCLDRHLEKRLQIFIPLKCVDLDLKLD